MRPAVPVVVTCIVVASVGFFASRGAGTPQARGPLPAATSDAPPGTPSAQGTGATSDAPRDPGDPPCVPVGWGQSPVPGVTLAALVIDGAPAGSSLDRCDRAAFEGPWAVTVRAPSGSLGHRGAVVTFPVARARTGRDVTVAKAHGTAATGMITWPIAGAYARVRGDLAERELIAIAARTTVVDRHPVVDPPSGLHVVTSGPQRTPTIHEVRYGATDLGESDTLGAGLVYTGIASSGGFEDQLYVAATREGQPVGGRLSVVSPVLGGNATLAWEPAPGLVAYVGYSGAELSAATIGALHRLATRTRLLDNAHWQATRPFTVDQPDQPG